MIRRLVIDADDLDHEAILAAVAKYQRECRVDGELSIPDAEDGADLRGIILAEICRDWSEYQDRVAAGWRE